MIPFHCYGYCRVIKIVIFHGLVLITHTEILTVKKTSPPPVALGVILRNYCTRTLNGQCLAGQLDI